MFYVTSCVRGDISTLHSNIFTFTCEGTLRAFYQNNSIEPIWAKYMLKKGLFYSNFKVSQDVGRQFPHVRNVENRVKISVEKDLRNERLYATYVAIQRCKHTTKTNQRGRIRTKILENWVNIFCYFCYYVCKYCIRTTYDLGKTICSAPLHLLSRMI